jgi:membrane protease YdiL (CAAX protease family)
VLLEIVLGAPAFILTAPFVEEIYLRGYLLPTDAIRAAVAAIGQ